MRDELLQSFDAYWVDSLCESANIDGALAAMLDSGDDGIGWAAVSVNGVIRSGDSSVDELMSSHAADAAGSYIHDDGLSQDEAESLVLAFVLDVDDKKKPGEIIRQSYVFITDSCGNTYKPKNGEELQQVLQQIKNRGCTITSMIIKGHGSGELITIGPGGDFLTVGGGTISIGNSEDPNVDIDITGDLDPVVDTDTCISLRGCKTLNVASDLDDALGGEPTVSGSPTVVIGIPWTGIMIGPWWSY